jgi:DNA polymerase-3 subunit epsilon
MKFAVVDLETTGGQSSRDRIIEIGIVIMQNGQIIDTYSSLVNPERSIPPFISGMTGITNEMVSRAPKFFEIAKDIVLKLKSHIFVAHNVNFDYNFLRHEFSQLGYSFNSKRLCTLQLSRKVYPEHKSHGLSKLVQRYDLNMSNRHRALGDAEATAEFLQMVLREKVREEDIDTLVNWGLMRSKLPNQIQMDNLHILPEKSGVYFLLDTEGRYLYIGKSNNIKRRVFEHFASLSKKSERMLREVADISYEITPGSLIALIKEDEYIKKHHPPINKAQKRNHFPYVIVKQKGGEFGYFQVTKSTTANKNKWESIAEFGNKKHALSQLEKASQELNLCFCQLINQPTESCWQSQTGNCAQQQLSGDQLDLIESHIGQYFKKDQIIIDPC